MAVMDVVMQVPFIREYLLFTGHLDASRGTMSRHMAKGANLAIIPGGEAEALRTEKGKEAVVLKGRAGFISLALQHGAAIVPTYTFGQVDTFHVSKTFLFSVREWIRMKLKMSIPVFWGQGGGPMPFRVPLSIAIGEPIQVPANPSGAKPDPAVVEEYAARYIAALEMLFDKHKEAAGCGDRTLEVMEVPGHNKSNSKRSQ
ncbi:Diacylglycerol O-acyltransferase 2 [Cymbomonas tetramitiformis]|uniref:diacylglycerol O-acyltransferase n=1 Tax=Cymbomonas tetramitiformis TaxID=36881 RepID=A0AAE0GD86_9CHLO|nr:Diacylglycerol O-acyltransferase 2 [Cymbomonas tetramitiformis]